METGRGPVEAGPVPFGTGSGRGTCLGPPGGVPGRVGTVPGPFGPTPGPPGAVPGPPASGPGLFRNGTGPGGVMSSPFEVTAGPFGVLLGPFGFERFGAGGTGPFEGLPGIGCVPFRAAVGPTGGTGRGVPACGRVGSPIEVPAGGRGRTGGTGRGGFGALFAWSAPACGGSDRLFAPAGGCPAGRRPAAGRPTVGELVGACPRGDRPPVGCPAGACADG